MMIDHTHAPDASSWVEGADAHGDFPVQNLPLGVFAPPGGAPRIGTAIGDYALDLAALAKTVLRDEAAAPALSGVTLNALFALPGKARLDLRRALFAALTQSDLRSTVAPHLHALSDCTMHLPAQIGDYTDFYVGIHHATNIGTLLRPDNPLLPNYKHVPIGYHGRASSVCASGHPVKRPMGQTKVADADNPSFGPTKRLDYELELGVWIAGENGIGEPVAISTAGERVAGLSLLNDWSARDFQAWEYQPLGPFLAKNFLTSVSPWVITSEALAPFRIPQPPRPEGDPRPLPYLWDDGDQSAGAFALKLEVQLQSAVMRERGLPPVTLSRGKADAMYWTVAQMIAHHSSNGCNLRPGDLLGTGTISGPERSAMGSLMEISAGGTMPIALPSGEARTFLEDGDTLTLTGRAELGSWRSIGFGACSGTIGAA